MSCVLFFVLLTFTYLFIKDHMSCILRLRNEARKLKLDFRFHTTLVNAFINIFHILAGLAIVCYMRINVRSKFYCYYEVFSDCSYKKFSNTN